MLTPTPTPTSRRSLDTVAQSLLRTPAGRSGWWAAGPSPHPPGTGEGRGRDPHPGHTRREEGRGAWGLPVIAPPRPRPEGEQGGTGGGGRGRDGCCRPHLTFSLSVICQRPRLMLSRLRLVMWVSHLFLKLFIHGHKQNEKTNEMRVVVF